MGAATCKVGGTKTKSLQLYLVESAVGLGMCCGTFCRAGTVLVSAVQEGSW